MIYLISGQPGNGKSLRAMSIMLDAYEQDQAAVKEGKKEPRRFFTNVTGAVLGEWYEVEKDKPLQQNPNAFPWTERLPDHNDWTKLPAGSFVVYDEAHSDGVTPGLEKYGVLFPATGKPGESQDPRIRAMSTHRSSFSMDLVLITQYPNKIHHQVRTLVGQHMHMNRAMGLAAAGMFTWTRTQPDPYDEQAREKAEEEIWKYPKDLYKRYLSAQIHTTSHKFRIPKKVWSGVSMLLVSVAVAWGLYHFLVPDQARHTKAKPPQAEASLLAPAAASSSVESSSGSGEYYSLTAPVVVALAGCIDSQRGCRCYNVEGDQIDQTQAECRAVVDRPLPFNIYHEYSRGQGIAQDNKQIPERGAGDTPADAPLPSALIGAGLYDVQGREQVYHPSTAN